MTLSVCDGFDVCHVLPWQWLLERLKFEQYSQIVELGIEIWEVITLRWSSSVPGVTMATVAREDKLSYNKNS